ncbi:hypothetical protein [Magnetospirillum molischianum]|uniref:Uncharacterized protein n=1 Tax=Magnetospirillum molischianum DSM 120 TaxID=1150626 RepID=H8FQP7_MAGML|nr:hypothetical protein [Magnetospirillum molischianum]CCG40685.1 membrane hypothetical protein [Magnetospirillum molischianum DSM 120]
MDRIRRWLFWPLFFLGGINAALLLITAADPYMDPQFPIGATEGPFAGACNYKSARIYFFSALASGLCNLAATVVAWCWRHQWVSIGVLLAGLIVGPLSVDYLVCWSMAQ